MTTELTPRQVLYEDADLLVVDKPAGLVSHATVDPARDHLVAAVTRMLQARGDEVGHLALQHRLDRDTSGAVLLSRRSELDAALGEAFARRRVEKVYLAVVRRDPARPFPAGTTELRTRLAPGQGPGGRTLAVRTGGKSAHTDVRVRMEQGDRLLVEARPRTGRTHQIRVHLAELGFPILGDPLYGPPDLDTRRLLLHAWRLAFDHPRTGLRVQVVAPPPRAFRARFVGVTSLEPDEPEPRS